MAVAALYALAMLLVGFAHVPLATGAERGPDLSAYALPDGTLPVFCATEGTGPDQPAARHGPQMCDACLVTAAPGLVPMAFRGTLVAIITVTHIPITARIFSTRIPYHIAIHF